VSRDLIEDRCQRADAERRVIGNRQVVLAALLGGEPEVTAGAA
jgi:hypothetical protein